MSNTINMRAFGLKMIATAAVGITSLVGSAPASAWTLGGNINYQDPATSSPILKFSDVTPTGAPDPGFSAGSLVVKDLPLTVTGLFTASNPLISNFISGFSYQGQAASFDLAAGPDTIYFNIPTGTGTLDFTFNGIIRAVSGGNSLANVTGTFSAAKTSSNNDFSMDFAATPVPTPALLPVAIGYGLNVIRKRRQGQEA
jgi:hypothetical protein